jgi:hypothetical protein
MITTDLTEASRANLKAADRVVVLRIEPRKRRVDRWVIRALRGKSTAYLSDEDGIVLFESVDAAQKFVQATRPDLAVRVEFGELVDVEAASRAERKS